MNKEFSHIKTGVIGIGSMGRHHARVYSEISSLYGVADVSKENGKKVANKYGVKYFNDYKEMLENVDAVTVATPTSTHNEVSKIVAQSKTNLLVEKPLAPNVKSAREILEYADKNDVVLSVGHIERHNPVISLVHQNITKGNWGKLLMLSSKRLSRLPERIKDVGVIFDLAIHDLDIINFISNGDVKFLSCLSGRLEHKKFEDHAAILLSYDNGIKALCEVSWLTPSKVRELSLTCNDAFVSVDYNNQSIKIFRQELANSNLPFDPYKNNEFEELNVEKEEPLKRQLINFLASVDSRLYSKSKILHPLVTGLDGLKAVELAELSLKQTN